VTERGDYVLVGCGQAKKDVDHAVPAEELYTSNYFELKKRYAEARSQPVDDAPGWAVLSAEHGVIYPSNKYEPYETTVDDLRGEDSPVSPDAYQHTRYPWDEPLYHDRLDFWTRRVHFKLASWLGMKSGFPEEHPDARVLEVLAGEGYIEPLEENNVFEPFQFTVRFPFREHDFDGIGEQMQWLNEEAAHYIERRNNVDIGDQSDLHAYAEWADPDIETPDVTGQTDWEDWLSE